MEKFVKDINNEEIRNCPLRGHLVDSFDCLKTSQAIRGFESKDYQEKLFKEFPNCKEICEKCEYNSLNNDGFVVTINI